MEPVNSASVGKNDPTLIITFITHKPRTSNLRWGEMNKVNQQVSEKCGQENKHQK